MKAINSKMNQRSKSLNLGSLSRMRSYHLQISNHLPQSKLLEISKTNSSSKNPALPKHLQEMSSQNSKTRNNLSSQTTTWWQHSYQRVISSLRIKRRKTKNKMIKVHPKNKFNQKTPRSMNRTRSCHHSKLRYQTWRIPNSQKWKVRKPSSLMRMKNSSN